MNLDRNCSSQPGFTCSKSRVETVVETAMCEICSKLTVRYQNDVNDKVLEDISHIALVFPYFEQLNANWNILLLSHLLVSSDCNWIRTHNHLVHKRTLNHLAKLAK